MTFKIICSFFFSIMLFYLGLKEDNKKISAGFFLLSGCLFLECFLLRVYN